MSDDPYKMVLTIGGMDIVASGPDPDWVKDRWEEMFKLAQEPAKKITVGFSVTGMHLERDYEC